MNARDSHDTVQETRPDDIPGLSDSAPTVLSAEAVSGMAADLGPGQALALLLDGELIATGTTGAGGAWRLPIPDHAVSGMLDVLETTGARSLLAAPLDLAAARGVVWHGWACDRGLITGRFALAPGRAEPSPVLVDCYPDDTLAFRAFAMPEDGAAAGMHRFSGRPLALLALGQSLTLRPRVNGVELDQPLTLTMADIGAVGHLDRTAEPVVRGWLLDPTDPARPVGLEVRLDGRTVATVLPDLLRQDLVEMGYPPGIAGFVVPFPPAFARQRIVRVQAFVAETGMELVGSPYLLEVEPEIVGSFDLLQGQTVGGWALDLQDPGTPLFLEAVCDGAVIGSGRADVPRADVQQSGVPSARCGFSFRLDRPLLSLRGLDIAVRVAGAGTVLPGSPRQLKADDTMVRMLDRSQRLPARTLQRLAAAVTHRTAATPITLVMPVLDPARDRLIAALDAVMGQWSANWELICIQPGAGTPDVTEILEVAASHDPRIRVIPAAAPVGTAGAINLGLDSATGAWIAVIDPNDVLEPDAVHRLAAAAQETGADIVYGDEAVTTDDIGIIAAIHARPAFSHDYLLSHPARIRLAAIRASLARALPWDEALPGAEAAGIDALLRAVEQARAVAHVPGVLYRRRGKTDAPPDAVMTGLLEAHLARLGLSASVSPGLVPGGYRIDWPDDGGEVLVVIPTKDRADLLHACIESLEATKAPAPVSGQKRGKPANIRIVVIDHESTDPAAVALLAEIAARHTVMPYDGPFNFARMNNRAVAAHGGAARHLLFMNNDVTAVAPGWIQRLRSLVARPGTGAVGPLLLYGDDRVQHAGVLIGIDGAGADHAMRAQPAYLDGGGRNGGYLGNLTSVRDYSAVTAACMMVRRDVFDSVQGFDETFTVGFNDTDLCLRIGETGHKVLYDGFTVLYHRESATRTPAAEPHPEDDRRLLARWRRTFTAGDPFFSPLLATLDHTTRYEGRCKGRTGVRVVMLPGRPAAGPAGRAAPAAPKRTRAQKG